MTHTRCLCSALLCFLLSIASLPDTYGQDSDALSANNTAPSTNQGKAWRLAYYEGGEYINYQQVLAATVRGLMELGWLTPQTLPPQQSEQTKALWDWLSQNASNEYLEFVADAHYSAHWDEAQRPELKTDIIKRLNEDDIDLIIALGTWAGKDLANTEHQIPTIVLSTSDPISAGIIKSVEDSGFSHVNAHVDPQRWQRQIRLFHEIISFKTLGVAYENTVSGKSYAAIDTINTVAAERGFSVEECYTQSDISDITVAQTSVINCFKELVAKVDAIYVTEQGGINNNSIPELVKITNRAKIPTFAQYGSEVVANGFLLSTSTAGYKYVGKFHAETIAQVLNGAKPNEITQLFEEPPKIAINLETAKIIGFNPPLLILGAADEIFRTIVPPK